MTPTGTLNWFCPGASRREKLVPEADGAVGDAVAGPGLGVCPPPPPPPPPTAATGDGEITALRATLSMPGFTAKNHSTVTAISAAMSPSVAGSIHGEISGPWIKVPSRLIGGLPSGWTRTWKARDFG